MFTCPQGKEKDARREALNVLSSIIEDDDVDDKKVESEKKSDGERTSTKSSKGFTLQRRLSTATTVKYDMYVVFERRIFNFYQLFVIL